MYVREYILHLISTRQSFLLAVCSLLCGILISASATSVGTATEQAFTTASGASQTLLSTTAPRTNELSTTVGNADVATISDVSISNDVTTDTTRSDTYQSVTVVPSVIESSSESADGELSTATEDTNNVTAWGGFSSLSSLPTVTANEGKIDK